MFLPAGSQDDMGLTVSNRNKVFEVFRNVTTLRGYKEISTPVVEFASTYTNKYVGMELQNMLKWFNAEGEIEVLRPDWTTAIARALRREDGIQQKWAYQGSVFRREKPGVEGRQAGIELIRMPSLLGESECLFMVKDFLRKLEASPIVVELAHSGIFEEIARPLTLKEDQINQLRSAMHDKRKDEVYAIVREHHSLEAAEEFAGLVDAYGSFDKIIEQYEDKWKDNEVLSNILDHLKKLGNILMNSGFEGLLVDLGRVKNLPYYSGTMFRGYFKENGAVCFSGGRYDHLYDQFQKRVSAVGLAFDVDVLAEQLPAGEKRKSLCILTTDESLAYAEALREQYPQYVVDVQYKPTAERDYDRVLEIQKNGISYEVKEI